MSFEIKDGSFWLNQQKVFLRSGEIHYFRIRRELWDQHLEAACEAGLRTVSTYLPWAWHEPQEGVFDFDGASCPERDLRGWLRCCQLKGLTCIVKPGPFILAETRGAGLPDWFLDRHREQVAMRTRNGQIVPSDGVSLFNATYLEKVACWYDQVMPFIREHELSAGGPVILLQLCNEIGVFSWLAHQADYSAVVQARFLSYLAGKFKTIAAVNALWGTAYPDFADVELPPDGRMPYASKGDRGRDYEWHCFWRTYYGDYLRTLARMARERGVTVPFYHNLPGWIYGSAYEFPVNLTMYADLFGNQSDLLFGVDHIPEFVSHRNQHDDRIVNDLTRAMQGNKPLFAAELQCGSREYHVVTNPREMELFYKASLAHGLVGWNFYMFSQGQNRRHRGYSGRTFYWFTPLTSEGERTSAFPLVQRVNQLVQACEPLLLQARRKAEICVLFYPPYYCSELERPETGASALQYQASAIRRPAYFDGLLKALQVLNTDYDMADLSQATPGALAKYKQVWAFSTDEMNARDQQALIDYATGGGQLVLFPYLPDREMTQKPCALLREALSVKPAGAESIDSPLIDILGLEDVKCANPQTVYEESSLGKAEVIARTLRGSACGFRKALGRGTVIHLGTWLGFDTEAHKAAYQSLLRQSGATLSQATASNEYLAVRERFAGDSSGLLFVANYYNEAHAGVVTYAHPATGEALRLPYGRDRMLTWPPLYGLLTPLCLEVAPGIYLLHTTSDLLGVSEQPGHLELILHGERDLAGEMVFEGPQRQRIQAASIRGLPLVATRDQQRVAFTYSHPHQETFTLRLDLA